MSEQGNGISPEIENDFYEDDGPEFIPCSMCDGHPACEDFGCAYENGCGHLVKKEFESSDF